MIQPIDKLIQNIIQVKHISDILYNIYFCHYIIYLKVDEVGKIVPYITSSLPANHMSLKVTNHSINHEIGMILF